MATSSQSNKILSLKQMSLLPHEELVSHLLQAQKRIQELEGIPNHNAVEDISKHPIETKSQSEVSLEYSADNSVNSIFDNANADPKQIMNELEWKFKNSNINDRKTFQNYHNHDFVVAYEYKGDFPSCDEDLSNSSLSLEDSRAHPEIAIDKDGVWDDSGDDSNINQLESLPLIPSPVLNTPPYEYIFLTKTNEAKCRIFLNQKLNKVFQEEIHKLQKREEELSKGKSQYVFDEFGENEDERIHSAQVDRDRTMDLHNQNHIVNSPSENEVVENVIHCFDPSDVDLELKKIFMEKPPVTHRIVRRKSRRERGSSVPAVDSYYGTGDLSKVGHASWFIPTLTESERKAIGWKHEYHYGHWKYAALTVPNVKVNQISLHPHVELDDANQLKQNHSHYYHSGTLHQNPLHHHEIDLSEPFVEEKENDVLVTSQQTQCTTCSSHKHKHEQNINVDDDTLSFITLSGCSTEASQSCHIIPDKSTLKRILKYILPCIKSNVSAVDHNSENSSGDHFKLNGNMSTESNKHHHELETLKEPSGKLNFPTSHTYISLEASIGESFGEHNNGPLSNKLGAENDRECHTAEKIEVHSHFQSKSKPHHHHNHHHHHQHGIFHWKKILSSHDDDSSNSGESSSVVGGDVIASTLEFGKPTCCFENEKNADGTKRQDCVFSLHLETGTTINEGTSTVESFCISSTESDSSEEDICKYNSPKKKGFRRLKPCKAFTKLLTLKDLGYETDDVDDRPQDSTRNVLGFSGDTGSLTAKNGSVQNHFDNLSISKENDQQTVKGNDIMKELALPSHSTIDLNLPRESNDLSPDSSEGFPFSSLSISHQNSEIEATLQIENSIPSMSASQTEQQIHGIETRFLDPKDLLILQKTVHNEPMDEDSLPFVFDFNNSQQEANVNFMDDYVEEQQDDNVIEWIGGSFVDEIEEELGLLSSCLDTLLKHSKPVVQKDGGHLKLDAVEVENEDAPEKVVGQHRITTLNDLDDQSDTINEND